MAGESGSNQREHVLESVYWVMGWQCHRKCAHCYDDRFRPYVRDKLKTVTGESVAAYARIVANLPDRIEYRTRAKHGSPPRLYTGRLILAGGEPLVEPFRSEILFPVLDLLRAKYGPRDGEGWRAKIVMQTTGDLVDPGTLKELTRRGVWLITCAGFDEFHVGMEEHRRDPVVRNMMAAFEAAGIERVDLHENRGDWLGKPGPFWNVMGAQPASWIGELWPRGRAWTNGLSTATYETNFCARQSGAWRFLDTELQGSEVAIEPDGSLYPCCLKTKLPLGNVAEEKLLDILASFKGHPVFEALNRGDPESMGESMGWDRAAMREASKTETPKGVPYENLCIGCDRFFEERLGPVIREIAAGRRARLTSPASA